MNNNPDPNQNPNPFSITSSGDTTPVMPVAPAADTTTTQTIPDAIVPPTSDSGTAAPIASSFDITPAPKKKFGTGKIVATILGLLVLVGGIGGGVYLTQQNQDINERAKVFIDDSGNCQGTSPGDDCDLADVPNDIKDTDGDKNVEGDKEGCKEGDKQERNCTAKAGTLSCTGRQQFKCVSGKYVPDGVCAVIASANCNFDSVTGLTSGPCVSNTNCANGYKCENKQCVAETSTACGRNTDPTAPVCCTRECTSGNFRCENPNSRLECVTGNVHCLIETNSAECGGTKTTSTTTTTNTKESASCKTIRAYNSTWREISTDDLKKLKSGDDINFCVFGATTAGTFDKAKLTINGVAQAETTGKRPGKDPVFEFCQAYKVPANVTTFNVTAQIHHATLGWK